MIYEGKAIRVQALGDGIVEMQFDLEGDSVNKFNRLTLNEFRQAVDALRADASIRGVLVASGKGMFIVGADITEFIELFRAPEEELRGWCLEINRVFSDFEDLPVPTVVAINGVALGGGFEMCLACDFRVMGESATVGLPEVKLGINPGFGGTVRLPRLIGSDNAIEWIAAGKENRAAEALKVGAVDAVVADDRLREAALDLLRRAVAGELDFRGRRQPKLEPLKLGNVEQMMAFESAKAYVAAQAGPHYPAPLAAVKTIQKAANAGREAALEIEVGGFVKLAGTSVAQSLVGLFLNEQELKRKTKKYDKAAREVKQAAVLGAGIMGGGIAYQSALKGTPILMKDIREESIRLGLAEADKQLAKRVEKGRLTVLQMAEVLNGIRPTLSYGDFGQVDLVIEAVVEKLEVKQAVLAEVEAQVAEDSVIASNTSTISISRLADSLERPERFCGMHFFNPVPLMPLVEVIRGERTGEQAIATSVAYARKMGKTPIVVNDCPGFLVNRVLFPYLSGFTGLLAAGIDFQRIDRVMEAFGWPMGPAYLLDVVGIDTAVHARNVLAEGYPERMKEEGATAIDVLLGAGRLGQKSGAGFYAYERDGSPKPKKLEDPQVAELLRPLVGEARELGDEEIVNRLMLPLCLETVRCLEEGVVESAAEADMGLIYGVGFPPFRGGALRYIDTLGVARFVELADRHAELGPLYRPTEKLRDMARQGQSFFA
ncbi:short chain enoyl-CoA hydratase /3-hydroxyacyl-CoA dehydrogenase [Azotobacter beijerinckii]|uniref:enoyl-CoA hydratase n=1 Tax=Azotobacter beijerinckii TaxID=170623 RepID=A0A1H6SHN7_9GAMM|nr:fatty acid oxidation complex subunit alpha FadB [Azotobacter beijerinckii]SEI66426.1 short chain enoyl-CoA hydratase /3-hydroxyacyl-CoA dehydrogenase [Azotobacter beijerinckii]